MEEASRRLGGAGAASASLSATLSAAPFASCTATFELYGPPCASARYLPIRHAPCYRNHAKELETSAGAVNSAWHTSEVRHC